MSTNTTDPLIDLHAQLTELLWRRYGYPGALDDAHPVTQETYRADAAAVLEVIERAHAIVPVDRWNRAQSVTANLRAEFDCAAGDEGCSVTDGELLDQALLALEALEEALEPGDGEARS